MRSFLRLLSFAILLGAALPSFGQKRPEFRPAVLSSGSDSLIHNIDAEALIKAGQKDGAIMFCAQVDKEGRVATFGTYRGTAGTDLLKEELEKQLTVAKMTPPIYEYQPVGVLMFGSVVFSAETKPHVKIFLNQDGRELKAESDFIGPQPVFGADSKFAGMHLPPVENPVLVNGLVDIGLKLDAKGNIENLTVVDEDPPMLGFGPAALQDLEGAKFIPAFRSGEAEASDSTFPLCYKIRP